MDRWTFIIGQYYLTICVFNITEHCLFLYGVLNIKKHICSSVSDHIDNSKKRVYVWSMDIVCRDWWCFVDFWSYLPLVIQLSFILAEVMFPQQSAHISNIFGGRGALIDRRWTQIDESPCRLFCIVTLLISLQSLDEALFQGHSANLCRFAINFLWQFHILSNFWKQIWISTNRRLETPDILKDKTVFILSC